MARNKTNNKEAKRRIAKFLDQAMTKFESEVKDGKVKPSMGDYLKLVQIRQEIDQEEEGVKEIQVRWIDPETAKSGTSE